MELIFIYDTLNSPARRAFQFTIQDFAESELLALRINHEMSNTSVLHESELSRAVEKIIENQQIYVSSIVGNERGDEYSEWGKTYLRIS